MMTSAYLNYVKSLVGLFGIYILWILIHYVSAHLYVKFCVPVTLFGFFGSPFIATLPQCVALRWIIYNGGMNIINMWGIAGSYIVNKLLPSI